MSWKLQHDLPEHYASELKGTQFSVLNLIISHVNHEKYITSGEALAWPSYPRMAALLHCSVSTVKRAVRVLRGLGYVQTEQMVDDSGAKGNNLYTLNLTKLFKNSSETLTQQEGSICPPKYINNINNNIININKNNKDLGGHIDLTPDLPPQTLTTEKNAMDRKQPDDDEQDFPPAAVQLLKRINNQRIVWGIHPIQGDWAFRQQQHIAGMVAWLMAKGYTESQAAGILWHRASQCIKFPKYKPKHLKPTSVWRREKVQEHLDDHRQLPEFQTDEQKLQASQAQAKAHEEKRQAEKADLDRAVNPVRDELHDQQRRIVCAKADGLTLEQYDMLQKQITAWRMKKIPIMTISKMRTDFIENLKCKEKVA